MTLSIPTPIDMALAAEMLFGVGSTDEDIGGNETGRPNILPVVDIGSTVEGITVAVVVVW